jgi:biofilm PGA synthesis N-glycosyltransferase PgaC
MQEITSTLFAGIQLLFALDARDLIPLFWFMIVLELPRYLVGAVVFFAFSLRRIGLLHFYDASAEGPGQPPLERRSFSVIIAGHNEAQAFPSCLRSILEQSVMHDTAPGLRRGQVVVVDDGSNDTTADVIADLQRQGLIDVALSLKQRGGKSAATNLALAHCRHDVVIVVDADTTFDRDAFERLIAPFDDATVGAVGGNLFVRNAGYSLTTMFQDIEYRISISLGRRVSQMLGILGIVSGAFGAFRRSALDSVGGFDVEIGEDADLTMKLRSAGWKLVFEPRARAGTDVPTDPIALIRQRLRWDRSVITIWLRKYKQLLNPMHENFRIANALVIWDVVFMQVLVAGFFFVYLGWLIVTFGWFGFVLLFATLSVYSVMAAMLLLIAGLADNDRDVLRRFLYLPYYVIFACFVMRAVRFYAAVDEWVFRNSYHDSYVPRRVMRQVEDY